MIRFLPILFLVSLFAFTGCRSRPPVELVRPSDQPAWRNQFLLTDQATERSRPQVLISTNKGDIVLELFEQEAPISTENFLRYVQDGFYNGTIFHRVIPGFMIQGGGFTPSMTEKSTRPPIRNEAGNRIRNMRGTVAMARTSAIDSATAQFFINVVDNHFLNGDGIVDGYAVFGRVVSGMDVVDAISVVTTNRVGPHSDIPADPVIILLARQLN
ncbi:MAG: peptidyl-prolyl cis-trans isomerase [Verrucomicrobia bacterium]|nr:peptidyl-prolyl cis-trans isomerase [Verrucomicrobiota bacterium]